MRKCEHGEPIQASSPRAMRAPACLLCHAGFLAEAAKRSHLFRAEMNEEERQAFLEYQREWGKRNRAEHSARRRLWRAERRLLEAMGTANEIAIQKRRFQLAKLNELIHVHGAW